MTTGKCMLKAPLAESDGQTYVAEYIHGIY